MERYYLFFIFVTLLSFSIAIQRPLFEWIKEDRFDEIMDKLYSVNADNCRAKPPEQLRLPKSTVTQIPKYNKLLTSVLFQNRTSLLHLHNMALNRAFYFSFIYQKINGTDISRRTTSATDIEKIKAWAEGFENQPGVMYMYMSTAADVSGGQNFINGSGIMFDNNCYYPNWYSTLPFNTTIPLFGPRAWRADDYDEPTNWLREPTNNTIDIHDFAAGVDGNYTSPSNKFVPWYNHWLPDLDKASDSLRKFTYTLGIRYSNETGRFKKDQFEGSSFFGPPQPGANDDITLPVTFTEPYFDCGKSNRWIVTATSPVVDFMLRYVEYIHLRRPR